MKTPVLETQRLMLRPFSAEDTCEVYECWQSDPEVARYMMWESSEDIKKTEEFIEFEGTMLENEKWYRWCIEDKENHTIYGTCLIYFNDEEDSWDISYNLGRKYWGKGYITEAMKKVMDFGIHTLGIKECIAAHAVENPASGHVIEKLGFKFEKEIPYICNGGHIKTTGKFYRLTVNE